MKLLLVDDEPVNLEIMSEFLSAHTLETAQSEKEALEKISSFDPDLVMLDLQLKDGDGRYVCREIKATRKHTRVVLVSGNSFQKEMRSPMHTGADEYLCKPFTEKEIVNSVERLTSPLSKPQTVRV